jgi:alpha-ketoglutarate-dependent taurine dioxygenase
MINNFATIDSQSPGLNAEHSPLVLGPDSQLTPKQFLAQLGGARGNLLELLARHGALLLRGFPVVTDKDFDRLIQAFGLPNFKYADSLSNAVRCNRTERVFTANEAPSSVEIYLHHEMAQTPVYPDRLFFFCEQAPASGGATPLCRSDALLAAMRKHQPDFVQQCADEGLRYTNVMPETADSSSGQGRSWRDTLGVNSKAAAQDKLVGLGYSWQWLPGDNLKVTTPVLPAIRRAKSGQEVFFNQLIAAFKGWNDNRNADEKSVCFGSGATIKDEDLTLCCELAAQLTYDVAWQAGDVALVDNFLMMHGRKPYQGSRVVLASLISAEAQ